MANINTSQINPNAFGYMPSFPEGSDGLSSFISGYMGAKQAGVAEGKPPVDAAGKPTGEPAPKPSFFNRFTTGFNNAPGVRAQGADPMFQEKLAGKAVEIQGNQLSNKIKLQMLTDTLEDQRTFGEFQDSIKNDPTILSTGELPAFKTPQYRMAASQQQLMYSRGVLMEKNKQIILSHQKGLAELAGMDPQSYAAISAMPDINGLPSPEAMGALGLAKERMAVQRENEKALAEIEALQRGDVPTTTITEKGVSTTYKPAAKEVVDTPPKTMNLEGGTTLAWVPGSKSLHVIKDGKKEELSTYQLSGIAKGLPDKDPRKKQITDFLANSAVAQTTPPAPEATTEAPAAPATEKVRMINPQGVPGFVPANQVEAAKASGYKLP